ncbi:MAG: carbonic anhydrase [Planctomycetota bacterium]
MISADEALDRLMAGNQRFIAGRAGETPVTDSSRRRELVEGQNPFAVVLGCSDSRVPAEIVFDQGLGDLFMIRVAGNIVAPSQIGSIEYAAAQFGTPLVVVLGHSSCGAVVATLDELQRDDAIRSPNLRSIVDRIRPGVEGLLRTAPDSPAELVERAVVANVMASVEDLRNGSEILEELVSKGELRIVGAKYSLDSGRVDFLPMI